MGSDLDQNSIYPIENQNLPLSTYLGTRKQKRYWEVSQYLFRSVEVIKTESIGTCRLGVDSLCWANASASSTIDTSVCINHID